MKLLVKHITFRLEIVFLVSFIAWFPTTLHTQTHQQVADSLLNLLPNIQDLETRIDLLNEISYTYRRISGEGVLKYAEMARQESIKIGYLKGKSIAHKNMGIAHYRLSSPRDSIIIHYQKSIDLATEINDYYTQAACNNNIALVFFNEGKFHSSIQYYLKGIEIFDTYFEEEMRLKALMLANIGATYLNMGESDKALLYMERAMDIAIRNEHHSIVNMYLDECGQILTRLGRFKEAEEKFNESLKMQDRVGDYMSKVEVLYHKIDLEIKLNRFEEAKKLALEANQISTEKGFAAPKIYSHICLAEIGLHTQDYKQAIYHGKMVLEEAGKIQHTNYQQDGRKVLAEAYSKKGEYKQAFHFLNQYHSINDSIMAMEKIELTTEVEAKYQNQEKVRQIGFLNKEKALKDNHINWLRGWIFLALLLAVFIGYLWFKRSQAKKKIQEKNEELERYIDYNLQLENFAYIASHDMKTPLRTIVSFSQLLQRRAKERLNQTEFEYLNFIINGTKEMSLLIDDLLNYSKIQRKELDIKKIELPLFLQNIIDKNKIFLEEKGAEINLDLQTTEIQGDSLKINQLFQNLLLNAVKFHKPNEKPKVTIQSQSIDNQWIFKIKDNGIGIEKNYFEKIFLIFKRLNKKDEYPGTGIGLAICKKIVDMHGGKIWVESELGIGSDFCFSLPKM